MPAECANPLFLRWIQEWFDVAKNRSTKGATIYKRAIDSLQACPLTLGHPCETQQLHGFGPKLCDRLTEKLKSHCEANGIPMPKPTRKAKKRLSGDDGLDLTPAKKPRKAKPKAYVPTFRSGAYALILALSSISENEFYTKPQLIAVAQEYCDSSFTAASDTTKFYTAWNSITTLENKDLVEVRGKPSKRYALTDEGWEVANRMRIEHQRGEQVTIRGDTSGGVGGDASREPEDHFVDLEADFNDQGDIGSHDSHLHDTIPVQKPVSIETAWSGQRLDGATSDKYCTNPSAWGRLTEIEQGFSELLSSSAPTPVDEDADIAKAIHASLQETIPKAQKQIKKPNHGAPTKPRQDPPSMEKVPYVPPFFEPIRLQPGTFSVELLLDCREVRSLEDRDYIERELVKKGIRPSVRSLELGDFFWVAKCHDPNMLGRYGEEGDEIALDWIVERKRLDDLISSVKDGRFHEQKFRLRRSGVKNVVYLIEETTLSQDHATKYHEMMESAIASTQVVDGYFVKRTLKLDDTIRYLARMTTMLKTLYESKPLSLIPTPLLTPQTYLPLLSHLRSTQPTTHHNITFPSFSSLCSKSASLTVRDTFLKMLMCTRGVTGDKALEIQKFWKTPRMFFEALEECNPPTRKGREGLLEKKLGEGVGRRKMGKKIFENLVAVWGNE